MIDFELLIRAQDQGSAELKDDRRNYGACYHITIKAPRLITDIFKHVHDNWENRFRAPGIAALTKHITFCLAHIGGFHLPKRVHLVVTIFPQAIMVVFGWESIKKCIKHEFQDPFGKIVNKGRPEIVRFFQKSNAEQITLNNQILKMVQPTPRNFIFNGSVFFFLKFSIS